MVITIPASGKLSGDFFFWRPFAKVLGLAAITLLALFQSALPCAGIMVECVVTAATGACAQKAEAEQHKG